MIVKPETLIGCATGQVWPNGSARLSLHVARYTSKYGVALDNLVSVDVVGADGRLGKASSNENADLFFGVRGAHSNLVSSPLWSTSSM
jgi:hypothetical protein